MNPAEYPIVAIFGNDTDIELSIFLEMACEEVLLAPGAKVELLARPQSCAQPIEVHYCSNGLQVFPRKDWDPDWYIRYDGRVVKPEFPTRISKVL
jgi:hypothetical protein